GSKNQRADYWRQKVKAQAIPDKISMHFTLHTLYVVIKWGLRSLVSRGLEGVWEAGFEVVWLF
ncbi:hypothetical protein, partial [Prosthecobacter dejongeii]|uniref:hypothetical protein n=1 Tax=Prosthecobacter dejongeii TaxID=48465 RepID=UPI001C8620BB